MLTEKVLGAQAYELALVRAEGIEATRDRLHQMAAVDAMNGCYGKGMVYQEATGMVGSQLTAATKQERKMLQYKTQLENMPVARECGFSARVVPPKSFFIGKCRLDRWPSRQPR